MKIIADSWSNSIVIDNKDSPKKRVSFAEECEVQAVPNMDSILWRAGELTHILKFYPIQPQKKTNDIPVNDLVHEDHIVNHDDNFVDEHDEQPAEQPVSMMSGSAYLFAVCGAAYLLYKYTPAAELLQHAASTAARLSFVMPVTMAAEALKEHVVKPLAKRIG